ncbi:hypothetical protein [Legionella sp. 16cNR16C]|uniref:hypothetical protein n=1 Tax=Legionella sp. 16cNR16C TaxID=2905656 RepID=UPI001E4725AB|nr:hypothetical protein [Legionella sp. 16cNR16C]MCE3045399.1 hypothetical protein [Legionella sp. 16cNR16C]
MEFNMILLPIFFFFCFVGITYLNYKDHKAGRLHREMGTNQMEQTEYNPATGLPMIGALDSMGNSIGSSASDRDNYWNNDYHRHSTFESSSYDPFSNRY